MATEKKQFRERDLDFDTKMSAAESLMWRVAADPWLDPSGSLVAPLDQPADIDYLRTKLLRGVLSVPRLIERVVEGSHALDTPHWEPDPDFHIDNHLAEIDVAAPGDLRALLELTTRLHTTPYEPDRPPWLIYSVRGLAGGKGALIARVHHSVADGIGALRISEIYLDLERNPEPPESVDVAAVMQERAAAEDCTSAEPISLADIARGAISTPLQLARAVAGEAALIGADPARLRDAAEAVIDGVKSTVGPLLSDAESGSPLWKERSGERYLITASMPLEAAKRRAMSWGGTINDLFVTALAEAAAKLHSDAGHDSPALSMSYVRSTRSGSGAGGNAFTPTPITAPAGPLTSEERFNRLRAAMAPSESSGSAISLDTVGTIAALLPSATISQLGRRLGRGLDLITSNVKGSPIPIYVGGAKVEATYPVGPVAGAAANATLMSYDGSLDIGVMIDPAAITDPERFRELLQATLDEFASDDD